ncbi:hypothetical protein [Serratia proteamaculans]|uniref:hypothetical protein n=1 Tax=Serratia proteamaculans TaxID=28151 RepID=UPI0021BDC468|nr:hypothetical protein [Serratia proteamaculans]
MFAYQRFGLPHAQNVQLVSVKDLFDVAVQNEAGFNQWCGREDVGGGRKYLGLYKIKSWASLPLWRTYRV